MTNDNPRRPAIVRESGRRHYAETAGRSLRVTLEPHRDGSSLCDVVVSRSPSRDHARVAFGVPGVGAIGPELTSYQLRRLASDLLDAADDIDANPADRLAAKAPERDEVAA